MGKALTINIPQKGITFPETIDISRVQVISFPVQGSLLQYFCDTMRGEYALTLGEVDLVSLSTNGDEEALHAGVQKVKVTVHEFLREAEPKIKSSIQEMKEIHEQYHNSLLSLVTHLLLPSDSLYDVIVGLHLLRHQIAFVTQLPGVTYFERFPIDAVAMEQSKEALDRVLGVYQECWDSRAMLYDVRSVSRVEESSQEGSPLPDEPITARDHTASKIWRWLRAKLGS